MIISMLRGASISGRDGDSQVESIRAGRACRSTVSSTVRWRSITVTPPHSQGDQPPGSASVQWHEHVLLLVFLSARKIVLDEENN